MSMREQIIEAMARAFLQRGPDAIAYVSYGVDCPDDPVTDGRVNVIAGMTAAWDAALAKLPMLDFGDAPRLAAGDWSRRNLDALIEDLRGQPLKGE